MTSVPTHARLTKHIRLYPFDGDHLAHQRQILCIDADMGRCPLNH